MSDGKVDVIQTVPMPAFAADRLAELFTVHHPWQADDADRFYGDVRDKVRGVATSGPGPLDRAFMDKLPKLEIIANFAVGVDAVDLDAAREKKIIVTNTPDVLTDCVADFAMGMVIAVMRRVAEGDRYVRAGRWATKGDLTLATSLRGKTLGIIGLGRIGKAVARRAEAFGMTIAYHGRNPQADVDYAYHAAPAALAAASDCLALTCPGGPGTYHLVDAAVLRALGPKSFLVNAARGSVVHEAALIEDLSAAVRYARNDVQRINAEFDRAMMMGDWEGLAGRIDDVVSQSVCAVPVWFDVVALPYGNAESSAPALSATCRRAAPPKRAAGIAHSRPASSQ